MKGRYSASFYGNEFINWGNINFSEDVLVLDYPNIENHGVINDPFDLYGNHIDNYQIYINQLDDLVADNYFSSALNIESLSDYSIDPVWHSQYPFSTSTAMGAYNINSNEFTLYDPYSSNPVDSYYALITHNSTGCESVVEIAVNVQGQAYTISDTHPSIFDTHSSSKRKSNNLDLTVYPNPSHGTFTVQIPKGLDKTIDYSISDLHGRVILAKKGLDASTFSIDLQDQLAAGIYFIQVTQGAEEVGIQRVVIE